MSERINIAIAEDHRLVRQGFIRMLSDYRDINVLFEASDGKELLTRLKEFKPSIILLDIAMPSMGGLKAMSIIKEKFPKLKVIVVSSYAEETSIIEYVKLGANSFLNKDCDVEQLAAAIYALSERSIYFDEKTSKLLAKHGLLPGFNSIRELTDKEIVILKHLCENKSKQSTAELTGIQASTVQWYKKHILKKTNCKDISELINYAKEHEYIN